MPLITRKLVISTVLCVAMMGPAIVARSSSAPATGDPGELLSAEQGEALVQFALNSAAHLRGKPDCSHLVHLVFSRAGLKYAYQPSRALYRGADGFERVKKPQPGDLIVWRGHVGIVVSPAEKTFFSSVRSGIITESWTEDQWLARGRPRFYRYRLGPESNPEMLAALTADSASADSEVSAKEPDSRAGKEEGSLKQDEDAPPGIAPAASSSAAGIATIRQHKKPGKKEIEAAFLESTSANTREMVQAETAIAGIGQATPVAVFTRADVQKVRVKRDKGSISIRLTETMAIEQGRVSPRRIVDREFPIERKSDGDSTVWVLTDPQREAYVPAAQALSLFQHCAELMLHNDPNGSGTRTIIKALNLLYDQPPSSPQRAALK